MTSSSREASLGCPPSRNLREQVSMLCSGVCNAAPQSHTGDATIPYLCMSAANLVRPDISQWKRDHAVRLMVPFKGSRLGVGKYSLLAQLSCHDHFQLSKTKMSAVSCVGMLKQDKPRQNSSIAFVLLIGIRVSFVHGARE